MQNHIRIKDPKDIPQLVELIHDRWLDAESITFDAESSIVRIRYFKEMGTSPPLIGCARFPAFECFLQISGVESFLVRDSQKIRFYDMNTVTYDPASMCVHLETGVPIEIRAKVRIFDIAADETERVVQA